MLSTTRFRTLRKRQVTTNALTVSAVAAGILTAVGLLLAGHVLIGFGLIALTFTAYTLGSQLDPEPDRPTSAAEIIVERTTPLVPIGRHRSQLADAVRADTLTGLRVITPADVASIRPGGAL